MDCTSAWHFPFLPQVEKYLHRFQLSFEDLMEISVRFRREMDKGLCRDTNPTAAVRMLPTFVCSTPDGTGLYAAPGRHVAAKLLSTSRLCLIGYYSSQPFYYQQKLTSCWRVNLLDISSKITRQDTIGWPSREFWCRTKPDERFCFSNIPQRTANSWPWTWEALISECSWSKWWLVESRRWRWKTRFTPFPNTSWRAAGWR